MDKTQYLLVCLAEEAGELQQAVAKALRFGLDEGYPNTDRTNRGDIADELTDVLAIAQLLQKSGALRSSIGYQGDIDEKCLKVSKWMHYSVEVGTLSIKTPN